MIYKVKLDIFEGPFDLLVYLIENAQMSIYDIQVAEITKQYIEYVDRIKRIDAALAGEFMVLAASLIEIKSKMLLPGKSYEDDSSLMDDPREELVQRLLEYKKYKMAATYLETQETKAQQIFTKPQEDLSLYTKESETYLSLDLIPFMKAFHSFLLKKMRLEEVQNRYSIVRQQQMTVEERIEEIKQVFINKKRVHFNDLLGEQMTRGNIVLTFLSMLELIRQKAVKFSQNATYGEIIFTLIGIKEGKEQ